MIFRNPALSGKVGNGAGDFQYTVISPGAQIEVGYSMAQK
jgi:hypothetical protein